VWLVGISGCPLKKMQQAQMPAPAEFADRIARKICEGHRILE